MPNEVVLYEAKCYNNNDFLFLCVAGYETLSELENTLPLLVNICNNVVSYIELYKIDIRTLRSGRTIESNRNLLDVRKY